jgi:hypothetical protein
VAPDALAMTALTAPVKGNTLILLGAGAVMVTTLWLSSKARSVTQTEVNLGRQDEGVERFKPGPVSRGIVRAFVSAGEATMERVPEQWRTGIAERFAREKAHTFDLDRPAFDTLRASVNLAVASVLIAFATSLKLPLSTTFVSFMVAMGTSLADQAWGRDSAVYRLAGVFSVIGGWLVTALAAFTLAGTFAFLIHSFGTPAVVVLLAAAVFALVHTHRYHANRSRMQQLMVAASPDRMDRDALLLQRHFRELVIRNAEIIDRALTVLVSRKRKKTRKLRASVQDDLGATQATESEFVRRLNRLKPQIEPWLMRQLDVLACERDFVQSAGTVVDLVSEHVLNEHTEPSPRVAAAIQEVRTAFEAAFGAVAGEESTRREGARADALRAVEQRLDALTERVLEDLYAGERSTRNTTLLLSAVLELRDVQRELRRASEWT